MNDFLNITSVAYIWIVSIFAAHLVVFVAFAVTSVANLIHYQKVMQRELYSAGAYMNYVKNNPRDIVPRHLGAAVSIIISVVMIIVTPEISLESELSQYADTGIIWFIVGLVCTVITLVSFFFSKSTNNTKIPFEWRFFRLYILPFIVFTVAFISYLGDLPKLYIKSALDSVLPMGSAYYANVILFAVFQILVIFLPIISNVFMIPLEKLIKKCKEIFHKDR